MMVGANAEGPTRSIAQLYTELTSYLDDRWGRAHPTWVFGEVQKLSDHRSGHCYIDLVDPTVAGRDAPTLKAKCWRSTWGPLKTALTGAGVDLAEGSVVRVRGYVDLYAPRGELGFIITAVDIEALRLAALGEHARRREELVRRLTAEGLLEANRAVRIAARESAKERARAMYPEMAGKNQQQMQAYREMPDEELFGIEWVRVAIGAEDLPGYKAPGVICAQCGERVSFGREVLRAGRALCRSCAGERYYDPA